MRRRKTILLIAAALLVVGPLALLLRKPAPLDLSNDEEPFKSMVLPPKSVRGLTYMDGGSAAIWLLDKNGVKYEITFPIDYDGIINAHPTAYSGNINDKKMIPLKNPARAKAIAVRLLRDYGKMDDPYDSTEIAYRALSRPLRTVPFRLFDRAKSYFN